MPDANLDSLLAYLRLNSQRYSPEALREHLVSQGYDPALVDQAMAEYRAGATPRGLSGWKVALGCLAGLVVGAASLVSLLIGLCGGLEGSGSTPSPWFFVLAAVLALLALGAALYPFFSKRRQR
jgi:H+/Cl- antiporter ClcA